MHFLSVVFLGVDIHNRPEMSCFKATASHHGSYTEVVKTMANRCKLIFSHSLLLRILAAYSCMKSVDDFRINSHSSRNRSSNNISSRNRICCSYFGFYDFEVDEVQDLFALALLQQTHFFILLDLIKSLQLVKCILNQHM